MVQSYPYLRSVDQDAAIPPRHRVVIVGAGPVGLTAAIDLAIQDIPVLLVDDNDSVSHGSRAICFAKRQLEIFDRLGCGDPMVAKGVVWNLGKVYYDEHQIFEFNLLPEAGHKRPAFINLQQFYVEQFLLARLHALQKAGKPIELRGKNKLVSLQQREDHVDVRLETPEGFYEIEADWLIACDGATSPIRNLLGLDFVGRMFEDNFLIADVKIDDAANMPVERRFWFDPPFNRGQSALLHKQPDNIWRIDLQLGWNIDKAHESKPENVLPRLKAFLGAHAKFTLEWVSIYTFQCRRMANFLQHRVIFAGDSAHQVSPFGARGANSGVADANNLAWKLKLVIGGIAPPRLLDSYNQERVYAADENILNSTRSTDFITPKSEISRIFRNAVLDLAENFPGVRAMVNSGRLSLPATYDTSPLNGPDSPNLPLQSRVGSPIIDLPVESGWLLDRLDANFHLITFNLPAMPVLQISGLKIQVLTLREDDTGYMRTRYLGAAKFAVYLVRPDQHITARWEGFDAAAIEAALYRAIGKPE